MAFAVVNPPGATLLPAEQAADLIPHHISTQGELNAWEQENISSARQWASARRRKTDQLLSDSFIRKLHKEMFANTWRWAGKYRLTDTNIGIHWDQIPVAVRQLCDNVLYQWEQGVYHVDELVARLHHRLVSIHPFPNGNGRHARLHADLVLASLEQPPFTWGNGDLVSESSVIRGEYLRVLRAADDGDYAPLLKFVRS